MQVVIKKCLDFILMEKFRLKICSFYNVFKNIKVIIHYKGRFNKKKMLRKG